jgi:molybdenum cofactor synthesis domain-containing protein
MCSQVTESSKMLRAAVLTVSDRSATGIRADQAGPSVVDYLKAQGWEVVRTGLVPDERGEISRVLSEWSDEGSLDVIVTTGGTGVAPRDVTPEATRDVADRLIPGMAEAMRRRSLEKTPHAMISRAEAGIRQRTLIVNVPGSPRAAVENLEAIVPALPHAVAKIQGDPSDCV